MDPTQIDHHASYHSPLHPLRTSSVEESAQQRDPMDYCMDYCERKNPSGQFRILLSTADRA